MHDCPACRVPLHGYEEICPSCGTRQVVRKRGRFSFLKTEQPGVNWVPAIFTILVIGVVILLAASSSWIGKVLFEGPPKEDALDKMSYQEARNIIETEITKGLNNISAKGTFSWTDQSDGKAADKSIDKPLQLTIDTKLPSPDMRKNIIDPIKDYMEKAKIPTLIMNDARSHATWTYNVTPPVVQADD